jgi:hypothetical protein
VLINGENVFFPSSFLPVSFLLLKKERSKKEVCFTFSSSLLEKERSGKSFFLEREAGGFKKRGRGKKELIFITLNILASFVYNDEHEKKKSPFGEKRLLRISLFYHSSFLFYFPLYRL